MVEAIKRVLLVEGSNDLHTIHHLVRNHIPKWPSNPASAPVRIEPRGDVNSVLSPAILGAALKNTDWDIMGVVVDADLDAPARWLSCQKICVGMFPSLPAKLPSEGAITANDDGKTFGFWLMPDCGAPGMLETFLRNLVPVERQALWQHAASSFNHARVLGSPCRDVHHDKARIHTWLAWQDPPGEPFGRAIARGILDPSAPAATPFITWFKTLYGL